MLLFAVAVEVLSMSDTDLDNVELHHYVQRWQSGDRLAADALFKAVGQRLEHMTRKMLRAFPAVHAFTETADVLQSSLIRLLITLRRVQPESTRHFFNLAAVHVRRELLDLARHFRADRDGRPTSATTAGDTFADSLSQTPHEKTEEDDLDLWCRFHEAVEQLVAEEREVVGLVFYHGWTQARIAELFQVDERTIRRRWQSACLQLHRLVGESLPQP
jgi:RNA polymerase sigma factor (sigma-70 family)